MTPATADQEVVTPSSDAGDVAWLTVAEVAVRLRVSTRTAYRLVNEGRIKAANFGSPEHPMFRIDEAVLERFIEEAQQGGTDDPSDDQPQGGRRP